MDLLISLFLGLVQGLTEFLPVSSSGHLALAQLLIPGFSQPGLVFDLALHGGTLLSVLALEWERIREALQQGYALRLALLLGVGTGATAAVALPLRDLAEGAFSQPGWLGCGFLVTAILLLRSDRPSPRGQGLPSLAQAVIIGLVQGIAVFPGLSRSGSTVVAGLWSGVNRRWAADFSFLLSVPAIGGALVVEVLRQKESLSAQPGPFWLSLGLAAFTAAASGFFALVLVRRLVLQGKLGAFSWYLLPLGFLLLAGAALGWWS
ncbi:MAG: undecaprenyl-diphosphate phosphatase [Thermoanaerobaculaceae bacterium]